MKVLFASKKNSYCCICDQASSKGESTYTAMEADIIVEGFRNSIDLHHLKYNKLIEFCLATWAAVASPTAGALEAETYKNTIQGSIGRNRTWPFSMEQSWHLYGAPPVGNIFEPPYCGRLSERRASCRGGGKLCAGFTFLHSQSAIQPSPMNWMANFSTDETRGLFPDYCACGRYLSVSGICIALTCVAPCFTPGVVLHLRRQAAQSAHTYCVLKIGAAGKRTIEGGTPHTSVSYCSLVVDCSQRGVHSVYALNALFSSPRKDMTAEAMWWLSSSVGLLPRPSSYMTLEEESSLPELHGITSTWMIPGAGLGYECHGEVGRHMLQFEHHHHVGVWMRQKEGCRHVQRDLRAEPWPVAAQNGVAPRWVGVTTATQRGIERKRDWTFTCCLSARPKFNHCGCDECPGLDQSSSDSGPYENLVNVKAKERVHHSGHPGIIG
ncbi:hypothetical protein PR048_033127 [Dryococelus australis]|uniref:Uncharacterized protein n=1 Tax=Dryococelus australis TaxID=614101 RepID=A0ABQ9G0M6_9NEOP|nr:hypothetical protein PR048_033127 [Dryococelus australis]